MNKKEALTGKIEGDLKKLTLVQLEILERASNAFANSKCVFSRLESSTLIDPSGLDFFGNGLILHHATTAQAFKKDKFEYLLRETARYQTKSESYAKLYPPNNPGADIIIGNETFSLKTQADKSLKIDELNLTKWMELGKGDWSKNLEDLAGLRDQFVKHLQKYDRILLLRCLSDETPFEYELLEIPKEILLLCKGGKFRWGELTKPLRLGEARPAYCDVADPNDSKKNIYSLYFDGRSEKKLHVKYLAKKHCLLHSYWKFGIE